MTPHLQVSMSSSCSLHSAVIPEENVVSATPPSEAQIRDIDSDVFTTESFVSTREKRKEVC